MEKDLKEYLDKISSDIADIRGTMATNTDIAEIKETMGTLATKKELQRVERKFDKKLDNLLEYVEAVDKDVSEHRRNTEVHNVKMRNA